ncbi:hypothetical protein ALC62_09299 [Cyphomyrmex costatus]|uniref:Uncharacterized protein n=1 Tax=Cyphomyrmex costatus TaxID=456900 RepID=A0A151IFM5_9HYME|nr:hypothetical protein ALC62_09299 [Cyphomyrmex costatus]
MPSRNVVSREVCTCAWSGYLRLAIAGYLIAIRFQLPFYSINKDKEAPSFNDNKSDPCVISQALPPPTGMGSAYRMGWAAGDSNAATKAGGVRESGTGLGGGGSDPGTLRLFQNKHTTWTGRIVSWLEACLKIGYVGSRTRKARVIVGVSVDWCRSTGTS